MKITIIKTVPDGVLYPDADTGQLDTSNQQASEPIRVLPAGQASFVTDCSLRVPFRRLQYFSTIRVTVVVSGFSRTFEQPDRSIERRRTDVHPRA